MIPLSNPQQVKNAVNTALYLTDPSKHNQHSKVTMKDMMTFGRGQI